MRKLFVIVSIVLLAQAGHAQELQARLSIISARLADQAGKKAMQTLQGALTTFINNRKWTGDVYQPQEKIKCNFILTIDQDMGQNVYKATLAVQAARPVYNSTYESPIINFQDNNLVFKYVEFQPIDYNENRIQGSDPVASNLTAVLAYYVYIVLGLDYDSFAPRGGDPYFQKAQFIVNNAPESSEITGWKDFDGLRNRYRLIEGLVDSRFTLIHDAIYSYYRKGFDNFYDNEKDARAGIFGAISYLNTLNQENQNSMIVPFFFQGKSEELLRVFANADGDIKGRARDMLMRLDLTNANAYKELK